MSRPLIANPKRASESAKWHREVFAMFGRKCVICGRDATDAAHVINRSTKLGPLRYASPRLGRPACRRCHEAIDAYEMNWPLAIIRDAIAAHNSLAKVKLEMP